jgi:hypothetical protein
MLTDHLSATATTRNTSKITLHYAEIIRHNILQSRIIQNKFVITPYPEHYAENFSV